MHHHIDISSGHCLSTEQACDIAETLAADLAEKFSIDYGWEGDVLHFQRPGVDGQIMVEGDHIRIQARLGFLLMVLKPRIEAEINTVLADCFKDT